MGDDAIPGFLTRTLLEDPWGDPELPPLVATADDGDVVGFIGSQVRRFRLADRTLRGVCPSHLIVAPDGRAGAAGALLLRRLLSGGQDFTFSDTANDDVVRIWQTFGGQLDAARACDWMIVLRPVGWLRALGATALRRHVPDRQQAPVGAFPFHAGGSRLVGKDFPEPQAGVRGEDVDAAQVVENLDAATRGLRLRPAYDEPFLSHLFGEIESQFGHLVRRLVSREGRAIGWYAYVRGDGGIVRLLHVSAAQREAEAVVGELVQHAREAGDAVISGRLEPHLVAPLRRRLAVVGFARQPIIHARDPELLATLCSDKALLTRLDSEWFAV